MFKLSVRNLQRNKRQNIFLGGVIVMCTAMMIILQGIINGTEKQLMNGYINVFNGNIQVSVKNSHEPRENVGIGKREKINWALDIKNLDAIEKEIKNIDENVIGTSPRIEFPAKLYYVEGKESISLNPLTMDGGAIIAVDPSKETNLFKILFPKKGSHLTKNEKYGIYVSETLANKLNLKIDGTLIVATTAERAVNAIDFIVAGIFSEEKFTWADYYCFINLEAGQELMNLKDSAMEVLVYVRNIEKTKEVSILIKNRLGENFDVRPWYETNKDFEAVLLWSKSFLIIMSIFLLFLIIPQIVETSLLILNDRIREIGILRAMGASSYKVVFIILAERVLLFIMSILSGVLLGFAIHLYLSSIGIPLSGMMKYPFGGARLYTYLTVFSVIKPAVTVFIISILSSLYPIFWACKVKPVEAIKYV